MMHWKMGCVDTNLCLREMHAQTHKGSTKMDMEDDPQKVQERACKESGVPQKEMDEVISVQNNSRTSVNF